VFPKHTLAIAHMLAANYTEAHKHAHKALELNPQHVHSIKILAHNYTLQEKYEEAITLLTQSIADEHIDDRDPYLLYPNKAEGLSERRVG
jgi:tetratricopeptide (TPR) repeat protein